MSKEVSQYDVIVLGAGASGLFCAGVAAKRGKRVLVLEKANKPGKKILMSGGGKCNFTNYYVEPANFLCQNPHFCKSALNQYTQWDFIGLIQEYGIAFEERSHGQLFCLNSAKDILNMLLSECDQGNVDIMCSAEIQSVEANPQGESGAPFLVHSLLDKGQKSQWFAASSLVVATGALSIPTLGGSGFGYELATQFGHKLIERQAGLVPFMFTDSTKGICERLSGLAVSVSISNAKASFKENLLFTHRGISGPAVLQISNYWRPGESVQVDLLPDKRADEWLLDVKRSGNKQKLKNLLSMALAKSLVAELQSLWFESEAEMPLVDIANKRLIEIGNKLNGWELKPSATEGYRTAEVTLGGVSTDEVSSKTMESKRVPGLYFIGEVLDVTGHLGGFNFQWAWSSGYVAGLHV